MIKLPSIITFVWMYCLFTWDRN